MPITRRHGRPQPMTDEELITEIEHQRHLMTAVATGGPRIQEVNQLYVERRGRIAAELRRRNIDDPNPLGDLWEWYARWSAGDLPGWASRRAHVSKMYQPLIDRIRAGASGIRAEQFQAVGLLCREVLISLAQVVYDPERHPTEDGVPPSDTDAKRMLDSYIAAELLGGPNEGARRHAKAALQLANDLQHHRTAGRREAALYAEATTSVVNIVAIISGRRD